MEAEPTATGSRMGPAGMIRWERFGRRMFRIEREGWTEDEGGYLLELKHLGHASQYVHGDLKVFPLAEWRAFKDDRENPPRPLLARPRFNLTSGTAITQTAKSLGQLTGAENVNAAVLQWQAFLETVCILLVEEFDQGGTLGTIADSEAEQRDVQYLFSGLPSRVGLVPDKMLSCLMAHGGQGKTLTADIMSAALASGQPIGPFNPRGQGPVLICDWELNQEVHAQRITRVCSAMGIPVPKGMIRHFRPLNQPLERVVDQIIEIVMTEGIRWTWIDSIGPAAAGELNSSEVATHAVNAMKEIPGAVTFLAHISKAVLRAQADPRAGPTPASPIGSQFFWNGAVAVYELKRSDQLAADGGSLYTLTNAKANLGEQWQRPLGMKLWFEPKGGPITCSAETITGTSPGGEGMPLQQRIADFAKTASRVTIAEIAMALAMTNPGQRKRIAETCEQMAARGFLEKWGLGERVEFAWMDGAGPVPAKMKPTAQAAFATQAQPQEDVPTCFCGAPMEAYLEDLTPVCGRHMVKGATG